MDSSRRRQYLEALGIETWQQRNVAPPLAAAVSSPPPPVTPGATVEFNTPMPATKKPPETAVPTVVPADWPGLAGAVASCMRCKLCRTRTNTVFGVGLQSSPLMVIGEGPGADEDAKGEPFVGRAGKLLDEMLKAIGRSRLNPTPETAVYIANVVKCRPPGNRDPEPDEVAACRPYLDQQIRLLKPKLILALGRIAAQRLLSTDLPLSKLRGADYDYGPERTPVLVTYHPAYLLRSPSEKAKSWVDLKRAHRLLAG